MDAFFEGRSSESPYIQMIWRGRVHRDYSPLCPADANWNMLFVHYQGQIKVTAEGPTTKSVLKNQSEGAEFLVIKFKHGVYMPFLPTNQLVDGDTILPEASSKSFWLYSAARQLPDFDNVETFVQQLVRDGALIHDPIVNAVLQNRAPQMSERTARRRFLFTTGLTQASIHQIVRAQQAATLLEHGVPILDAVYEAGYADQPHMTRSLKRYYGRTPAQIARQPE